MSSTIDRRTFLKGALALLAASFGGGLAEALDTGNFKRIYSDPELRDRFYWFLQNVFHLYPEKKFHKLILDLTNELGGDDRAIYERLLKELPKLKPLGSEATYMLPALKKQKAEMAKQAAAQLEGAGTLRGYLEIGTTGRYVTPLKKQVNLLGPVWLINDAAPNYGVSEIVERGSLPKVGSYLAMGNYDPFAGAKIPEGSLDLVTNFIGFHHCPTERLDGFVDSIRRVLRPGGRLLLRDHDCPDAAQTTLVALAHDVFNAGLFLPWKTNAEQVRLFRSIRDWTSYLEARGFKKGDKVLAQDHDPTKNLLLSFTRV